MAKITAPFVCVFVFAIAVAAVAQSVQPERFLKPTNNNFAAQLLRERIATHHRGDMADAADLQEKLAEYYSAHKNPDGARICEERAKAARARISQNSESGMPAPTPGKLIPAPTPGTLIPAPTPGTLIPAPTPGTLIPAPTPGALIPSPTPGALVPTPTPGNLIPVPTPGQLTTMSEPGRTAPMSANGDTSTMPTAAQPFATNMPPSVPTQPPSKFPVPWEQYGPNAQTGRHSDFHGAYQAMVGRVLHKWDFYENGMFLHETIVASYGASVRNSERGEFAVNGNKLSLTVRSQAGGAVTSGVDSTMLSGGHDSKAEVRTMTVKPIGAHGEQGVVLDGVQFKVRSWQ